MLRTHSRSTNKARYRANKETASKVGILRVRKAHVRRSALARAMSIFLRRYFYSRLAIERVISYARARKHRGIEHRCTRDIIPRLRDANGN